MRSTTRLAALLILTLLCRTHRTQAVTPSSLDWQLHEQRGSEQLYLASEDWMQNRRVGKHIVSAYWAIRASHRRRGFKPCIIELWHPYGPLGFYGKVKRKEKPLPDAHTKWWGSWDDAEKQIQVQRGLFISKTVPLPYGVGFEHTLKRRAEP